MLISTLMPSLGVTMLFDGIMIRSNPFLNAAETFTWSNLSAGT